LFSDGESLTGAPDRVAAEARSAGIPVITVVAGSSEGATIPTGNGSVVVDEDGRPVVTRAAAGVLREISDMTGSVSTSLRDPDVVAVVTDQLLGHVDRREETGFRFVPVERYPLFVGAALVALALSLTIRVVRWKDLF
jgi:Ca-activated chloride channel family protein